MLMTAHRTIFFILL